MALFDESTITDSGVELLNAQLAGQRLTVTSAYAGTGCVDKDLLHAQTDLVDQRQKTVLVSLESYEDHKRIRVQISNAGLQEGYKLQQLLINAVLDSAENSEETALLIMQDPKGIDMPSETESPGFELEMYCVLLVTNKLQIGLRSTDEKAAMLDSMFFISWTVLTPPTPGRRSARRRGMRRMETASCFGAKTPIREKSSLWGERKRRYEYIRKTLED